MSCRTSKGGVNIPDFPGARVEQQNRDRVIEVVPASRQVDTGDADPESTGEAADLGGIAGQAEETGIELPQISGEHGGRIPLRVHRDQEHLQARKRCIALHPCQLGKCVRALVGTVGEPEEDERRVALRAARVKLRPWLSIRWKSPTGFASVNHVPLASIGRELTTSPASRNPASAAQSAPRPTKIQKSRAVIDSQARRLRCLGQNYPI